jgi:NodT family efflux transporter outer membrane factor (OMF) lipoprotein
MVEMPAAMHLKSTSIVLAAAAMTACVQLAPSYQRPPAPVPAVFPSAGAASAAGGTVQPLWQDYFRDPALRDLIERALKNNRDLRIAVLNIDLVRTQYQLRRADQWPTLNAGLTAARAPGSNGALVNSYSAGLVVATYELDLFGRVRSLSDSAAAQVLATEEARNAAQISLVASVAQQYLALAADDELLDLTRRTLKTRDESLQLTRLKFDNGAASELDVRLAESLLEAARVTQAQAQRQRELDRNALVLLVGQELPELPSSAGRIDAIELADVPAGMASDVLLVRPDVRQAEQQLIGASANIGAARAAFWPRITLTSSAGVASSQLSTLFQNGVWTYAAQLLQPIFDAGRNQANLAAAETQRDIAVAQYERAIQAAFRDVADALAGQATLAEQLRATRAQADAESARYRLSEVRFQNGVSSTLDLLDAQRSLFAAQQSVIQTQLALLQNRVAVYRAMGGGVQRTAAP